MEIRNNLNSSRDNFLNSQTNPMLTCGPNLKRLSETIRMGGHIIWIGSETGMLKLFNSRYIDLYFHVLALYVALTTT